MLKFKEHLNEGREVVQLHQVTAQELTKLLGKRKITSMSKNPFFRDISNYEHAFKYAVSTAGFETVEVYAFYRSLHTTESGKIRPEIMIQFTFAYSGQSVIQADKYYRKREPDENEKRLGPSAGWRYLNSWKEVKEENTQGDEGTDKLTKHRKKMTPGELPVTPEPLKNFETYK
jgi:hypothetical protein